MQESAWAMQESAPGRSPPRADVSANSVFEGRRRRRREESAPRNAGRRGEHARRVQQTLCPSRRPTEKRTGPEAEEKRADVVPVAQADRKAGMPLGREERTVDRIGEEMKTRGEKGDEER